MTQEKKEVKSKMRFDRKVEEKVRERKDPPPTKIVVRRLPPSLTSEAFLEQVSPLPDYDYFSFVKADMSLGKDSFTRAYLNFVQHEDIYTFTDKFDGYVFVDPRGGEYPAVVELAPFQKIPKKKGKKLDPKKGTLEQDADYLAFVEMLQNPESDQSSSLDNYLEELETKEKELKANHGCPKVTTPLIDYIRQRKEEKRVALQRSRDERRKKELERKKIRDDDRKRRKEREEKLKEREKSKDSEKDYDNKKEDSYVKQLLKNPEREKDRDHPKDRDKENYKEREKSKHSDSEKPREQLRFSKENRERAAKEKEEEKARQNRTSKSASSSDKSRVGSAREDKHDSGDKRKSDDRTKSSHSSDDRRSKEDRGKGKDRDREDTDKGKQSDRDRDRRRDRGWDKERDKYREQRSRDNNHGNKGRDRDVDWERDKNKDRGDYRDRDKGREREKGQGRQGSGKDKSESEATSNKSSSREDRIKSAGGKLSAEPSGGRDDKKGGNHDDESRRRNDRERYKVEGKTKGSESDVQSDRKGKDNSDKPSAGQSKANLDSKTSQSLLSAKDASVKGNNAEESDASKDDGSSGRRRRKDRPERAIYVPRKARESRSATDAKSSEIKSGERSSKSSSTDPSTQEKKKDQDFTDKS
ncbi:regulator of nonsense transcripts 3B-like isoform X2 [Liolophura sinensis]|uniref:regulator of nonsense transcripts 3B-like isoform X2 n=1 Tax=Liolophura sinensis TaxID=3198878 RepID=UPI003158B226